MLPVLRPYRPVDDQYIYDLHVQALRAIGIIARPRAANADLMAITAEYLDRGGEFIIAEIAGHMVGYGAYLPLDAHTIEVRRMRVAPERQGQGIGTAILNFLLSKAQSCGFRRAVLDTDTRMKAAIALYRKAGFTETGRKIEYGEDMLVFEAAMAAAEECGAPDATAASPSVLRPLANRGRPQSFIS